MGDKLIELNPKASELLDAGRSEVTGIMDRISSLPSGAPDQAQTLVKADPNMTAGLASAAALIPGLPASSLASISVKDRMIAQAKAGSSAIPNTKAPEQTKGVWGKLYNVFKGAVRTGTAALYVPYQGLVQGGLREFAGNIRDKNYFDAGTSLIPGTKANLKLIGNSLKQTDFGQLTAAIIKNPTQVDTGSGYFIGGVVAEKSRQEAIKAYNLNGTGLTLGRGLASLMRLDPDKSAYGTVSGLIDVASSIFLDPTILAGKAKTGATLLKEADNLSGAVKAAKTVDTIESVKQLAKELDTISDSVRAAKIADAASRVEVAKAALAKPQTLLAELDPKIAEPMARISQLEARKLELTTTLKTLAKDDPGIAEIKTAISDLATTLKDEKKAVRPLLTLQRQNQALAEKALAGYTEALKAEEVAGVMSLSGKAEATAKKYADALEHLAGLTRDPAGEALAYDKLATFLGGKYAEPLIDHFAQLDDPLEVWDALKRSVPVTTAQRIANAKNREEVLGALAPLVGTKLDGPLDVSSLARLQADAAPAFTSFIPHYVKDVYVKGVQKIQSLTGEIPNGRLYHIDDTDGLARAIVDYGTFLKLPREKTDDLLRKFLDAGDDSVKAKIASIDLFNAIYENAAPKLTKFQREALQQATRIFDGGKTGMSSYWASRHASGAHLEYVLSNGTKVMLKGPHLESELLNSSVYLPNPDQMRRAMSMFTKTKTLDEARAVVTSALDTWRTSRLLRPAYTIRNVGEMQVRTFLTGHASFLNNPGAMLGMVMGRTEGPKWRQLLGRMEQYSNDALGRSFKYVPNSDDEIAAAGAIDEFIQFLGAQMGSFDKRASRAAAISGVTTVEFGSPKFFTGLASEIRKFANDHAAQVLAGKTPIDVQKSMKLGSTWNDAVIDYFYTGKGSEYMARRAAAQPAAANLFTTRDGIAAFLFDETNGLLARVNEVTGRIPALKTLIAHKASKVSNTELYIGEGMDGFENLSQSLSKLFKESEELKGVKVNVRLRDAALGQGSAINAPGGERIGSWIDSWFRWNNKIEKNVAMAPEWRQVYWEEIAKVAKSLDADALAKLQVNAEKSLLGLRVAGKTIGESSPIMRIIKSAKGDGPLDLAAAHAMAAEKATKHVKGLFYDAYRRNSFFHAFRQVLPFGQAWWDTLHRWGQLAVDNPIQLYKAAKFMNAAQEPGSRAVYDASIPFTGIKAAEGYDPNQGFIYTDPQTGQRRFFIPFAGSIIGGLAEIMSGVKTEGSPFQLVSDPMSLNLAFGSTSIAPPIGPGITVPMATLGDSFLNSMPMAIRTWMFPFGKPNSDAGIIESNLLPSWAQRIMPLFSDGGAAEATYASTVRPVMDYLASGGGYDLYDTTDQERLLQDANKFARFFGVWRGITQAISPSTPLPSALAKYEDSENQVAVVAQAGIYNAFQKRVEETGDYYQAVRDTLDAFGVGNIYALIGATKGGTPPTTEAFDFLRNNPKLANKYSDVFGLFFPNGDFSQEYWRWQTRTNKNAIYLTPDQVNQQAGYMLYMAAKSQLDIKEAAGTITKAQKADIVDQLNEIYGGSAPTSVQVGVAARKANPTKYMIQQVKNALTEPAFANTKAGQAAQVYLALRQSAIDDAQLLGRESLNNKASAENRAWLRSAAEVIDQYFGGEFALLYRNVFENEVRD